MIAMGLEVRGVLGSTRIWHLGQHLKPDLLEKACGDAEGLPCEVSTIPVETIKTRIDEG